jgi:tetratricopeptide (TPR) repeat protein
MKTLALGAVLFGALLTPPAASPALEDEDSFLASLEKIERKAEKVRPRKTTTQVLELLDEHAGADHVLRHRTRIVELLESSAFLETYTPPDPAELISGNLEKWNPRKRELELSYEGSELPSLTAAIQQLRASLAEARKRLDAGEAPNPLSIEQARDWVMVDGTFFHRAQLQEDFEVEVDVAGYGRIAVGADSGDHLVVVFHGDGVAFSSSSGDDESTREVESNVDSKLDKRKKQNTYGITVSGRSIRATVDGKAVGKAKLAGKISGRLMLPQGANQWGAEGVLVGEVRLRGKVAGHWLSGLQRAHEAAARAEFLEGWDVQKQLPEWLRVEVVEPAHPSPLLDGAPEPLGDAQLEAVTEAFTLLAGGDSRGSQTYLEQVDGSELGEPFVAWLWMRLLFALERYEEALERSEQLVDLAPDHVQARVDRAFLRERVEAGDTAVAELGELVEEFPDAPEPRDALATLLVQLGELDAADDVLEGAVRAGIGSPGLERASRRALRARIGPRWGEAHEFATRHYRVFSDHSHEAAFEMAQELEAAYRKYSRDLDHVPSGENRRFRTYVFADQASYLAFCEELGLGTGEGTAGMFSPALGQLLLWMQAEHASTIRTARHEGFHQYLDRLTQDAPVWLNEGLAEYYEPSVLERGSWKDGLPHPVHMDWWRSNEKEVPDLGEFLHIPARLFYADAGTSYAYSWGLVHFLRNGDRKRKEIFGRLWKLLLEGTPGNEAVEQAFRGVDLATLQAELRTHVRGL